jgi:hypothetical protein
MATFPPSAKLGEPFALAPVARPRREGAGRYVIAEWKGQWYKAVTLETMDGRTKVHYVGYGDEWDEWLTPDRLKPFDPKHKPPGTSVQVEWQGKWYPAKVLAAEHGLHFISYDGYGPEWNEWVPARRMK